MTHTKKRYSLQLAKSVGLRMSMVYILNQLVCRSMRRLSLSKTCEESLLKELLLMELKKVSLKLQALQKLNRPTRS